jgi:hypothetical protein
VPAAHVATRQVPTTQPTGCGNTATPTQQAGAGLTWNTRFAHPQETQSTWYSLSHHCTLQCQVYWPRCTPCKGLQGIYRLDAGVCHCPTGPAAHTTIHKHCCMPTRPEGPGGTNMCSTKHHPAAPCAAFAAAGQGGHPGCTRRRRLSTGCAALEGWPPMPWHQAPYSGQHQLAPGAPGAAGCEQAAALLAGCTAVSRSCPPCHNSSRLLAVGSSR